MAQDKINFLNNFGHSDKSVIESKKRGRPKNNGGSDEEDMFGISGEEEEEGKKSSKKLKTNDSDYLDIGSVSWSMMLSLYFLTLHDDS